MSGNVSKRRFFLPRVFLLIIASAVTIPLSADQIFLRSGEVIEGKVVGQTREVVRISIDGKVKTISKLTVKRIAYTSKQDQITQESALKKEAEAELKREQEATLAIARKKAAEEERQLAEKKKEEARLAAQKEAERLRKEKELQKKREDAEKGGAVRLKNLSQKELNDRRLKAFLRSAVLPGWAQWDQGRRKESIIYGGSFWLLAGATAVSYKDARSKQGAYERAGNTFLLSTLPIGIFKPNLQGFPQSEALITQYYFAGQRNTAAQAAQRSSNVSTILGSTLAIAYLWNMFDGVQHADYEPALTFSTDGKSANLSMQIYW